MAEEAEVVREAEAIVHPREESAPFVRRARVETMRYFTVQNDQGDRVVQAEVMVATPLEQVTLRLTDDADAAPFRVDQWVEIQIRRLEDQAR